MFTTKLGPHSGEPSSTLGSGSHCWKYTGLPRSVVLPRPGRTCVSLLLCKGVHSKIVQELLGHSTITLGTYSYVLPGLGGIAASAVEGTLSDEDDEA